MSDLFNDQTKRDLRVRAGLDRIEAESEQKQSTDPEALKISFNEDARAGYESLAGFVNQPASTLIAFGIRQEKERFAQLSQDLGPIVNKPPEILELACYNQILGESAETTRAVLLRVDQRVIKLFDVVCAGFWESKIERLLAEDDPKDFEIRLAALRELVAKSCTTNFVTASGAPLNDELVLEALQQWLAQYAPRLVGVRTVLAKGNEINAFKQRLATQSLLTRFHRDPGLLDKLVSAFEPDKGQ